jgi:hypothetical protein
VYSSDGSSTASFAQCASCGNPGTAGQFSLTQPYGQGVAIGMINTTFTYDPATQGAFTAINTRVDKQFYNPYPSSDLISFGNFFRPLIEQGGNYYEVTTITDGFVFQSGLSSYRAMSGNNLTAADFVQYDPLTGLTNALSHPNFASGTMEFGIMQFLGGSNLASNLTVIVNYDNLSINSVPEPSTWALLLLGFSGLGLARYKASRKGVSLAA